MRNAVVVFAVVLCACTTLGPMPVTTGVSALQAGRPTVEAQAGIVPSYYLSTSVQDKAGANPVGQASLLVEPDSWLGIPGLIVGARTYGNSGDSAGEPYLGLRHTVDDAGDVSLAGVAFGTSQHAAKNGASYQASRIGGEVGVDIRVWKPASWLSGHLQGEVSATRIDASGTYCATADGKGTDCSDSGPNNVINGSLHGLFPSATGTIALDILPSKTRFFAGARLAVMFATGRMPVVINGAQDGSGVFYTGGLSLTLGFGGDK